MNEEYAALRLVETQAKEMATAEGLCESGYAHLGWLLFEVSSMRFWMVKFGTFKEYLESVAAISKKTPGQLQRYMLTVRDLSGTFNPEELESMGITKATQLRVALDYAIVLPVEITKAALDPKVTVKDLKKLISTTLKMPQEESGDWMDLDGFMVTPEERRLISQAVDVAKHTEPLTKPTLTDSAQLKDVVIKWCMEFLGAHSGDGQ